MRVRLASRLRYRVADAATVVNGRAAVVQSWHRLHTAAAALERYRCAPCYRSCIKKYVRVPLRASHTRTQEKPKPCMCCDVLSMRMLHLAALTLMLQRRCW
jgi:hypothetical protein